jgi:hypothetical protein
VIVDLRHGPSVREAAIALALELERRGISLRVDHAGTLKFSGPRAQFTEADALDVERHRSDLKAIVRYCEATRA